MRTTPTNITELHNNEVFVFGSNLSGIHAGGAARFAHEVFGATWGIGSGIDGNVYAIPTVGEAMNGALDLNQIKPYVDSFINYAKANPDKIFLVTPIGCGIAGFTDFEIAPLFKEAITVRNIYLPQVFWNHLKHK